MQEFGIFVVNHWLLFVALVIVLVMLVMTTIQSRLLGYEELKPADLVQMINRAEPVLLDVRNDDEFGGGHLASAHHIPLEQLAERQAELQAYRDRPIVVYCRSGQRSARAATILKKNGFARLYKLAGGMLAWQNGNLPVSKS